MDKFQAMRVYMAVVDARSFSRAADNLNLPRATVTTTVQGLENFLKVRLLNRTTRSVSLTPDGAAYYERCARILGELEEMEAAFRDVAQRPQGRLRIDVPTTIGRRVLVPRLCDFRNRYPDIELVIGMSDRPVDLVQEAVDCVIRGGELLDSSLVARRIGSLSFMTCAAPAYLERYGTPRSLGDLEHHQAVHYFSNRTGRIIDWDYVIDGSVTHFKVKGSVAVNDAEAYMALALQGFGLVQAARFMALPHLERQELIEVLPQWRPAKLPLSVLYPQNRHLSPKVRAFSDWAAELFSQCPLLNGADGDCHVEASVIPDQGDSNLSVRDMIEQRNLAECGFSGVG
ncbi:LysR family transcriptional regulator [Azospira sp. I13]|uniref:LysR family transcriptional regulator n=1 Tax=Azospira sp. I13 TaxID=1765050 RepID=UPI000D409EFF|nr:LysR family transcriptional regulator [Azospira sp. I13]GBG03454.1 LysR family transcriptional regulator [Azospira sp. I13]